MIKLLSVAMIAGLLAESNQQLVNVSHVAVLEHIDIDRRVPCWYPTNLQCWTEWFDRDNPSGTGDWEVLSNLRTENPGKICNNPLGIQVRTTSGLTTAATGDVIDTMDTTTGFICRNRDQNRRSCYDYRVRFSCHPPFCGGGVCWTKWFDRDNPGGTGDWEHLSALRSENPRAICLTPLYIEAVTADTGTPAISTGQVFYAYNPTDGFICRNNEQKTGNCRDYKVRFGCPCDCLAYEEIH